MKKLLAALTLVACIFIASSAMAAGVKVPKTLCVQGTFTQQLCLKASGTAYYTGGIKIKTYAINGIDSLGRDVTGTAYVEPNTNTLHAMYTCEYPFPVSSPTYCAQGTFKLTLNLASGSGTVYYRYYGATQISNGSFDVNVVDCLTASTLAGTESISPEMDDTTGMNLE